MNTQEIFEIISNVKGKKVAEKRKQALIDAGFNVSYEGVKYNFGRACTIKEVKGKILAQLKYARGGKARNGFGVNRCEVYSITK